MLRSSPCIHNPQSVAGVSFRPAGPVALLQCPECEYIVERVATAAEAAEHYVKYFLTPGQSVCERTDGPIIAAFRDQIPKALARRGLHLVAIGGEEWKVVASVTSPCPDTWPERGVSDVPAYRRVRCRHCNDLWFECGCVVEILNIGRPYAPSQEKTQ